MQDFKFTLKHLREEAIVHLLSSPLLCKNAPYGRKEAMLDVDVLLCFLLEKTKAHLLAHLDADAIVIKDDFDKMLEKRYQGISIAYIIGEKEFFALNFYVNPSVLIPKSDTEVLVEASIQAVESLFCKREWDADKLNILDVFSGSGCVGIAVVHSLLSQLEKMQEKKKAVFNLVSRCSLNINCSFLDISRQAIDVSCINAKRLLPAFMQKQLSFFCQDATKGFLLNNGDKYDIIVANPPYISHKETEELLSDGRGEPCLALDGGADGFAFFSSLAQNGYDALKEGGILFCEVGDGQAEHVKQIFAHAGFEGIEFYKDLSQTYRVVQGEKRWQ